jgi:hypothetical protein
MNENEFIESQYQPLRNNRVVQPNSLKNNVRIPFFAIRQLSWKLCRLNFLDIKAECWNCELLISVTGIEKDETLEREKGKILTHHHHHHHHNRFTSFFHARTG